MSILPPSSSSGRTKITLVGSGQIGAIMGLLAGLKRLGDVTFVDVIDGVPQGKALDLSHLTAVANIDCCYTGTTDYSIALTGADVVIITAGHPVREGMTRSDLFSVNSKIIKSVADAIKAYCPKAFVICLTNPLDQMVYLLQKVSGLPSNMVVGMAGALDSSRLAGFVAERLGVSNENVSALVIGLHSDRMVPLPRFTTVAGISLPEWIKMGWITQNEVDAIVERTKYSAAEIRHHLKTGSPFLAPAANAIKMAEAFLQDRKSMIPCSTRLNGQYGVTDLYVGVPAIIGRGGVERIVELPLNSEESAVFHQSIDSGKELFDAVNKI